MDVVEVQETVLEIVRGNATMNVENVNGESHLKQDHGIDSIKMVEFILEVEEEFDIEIENSAIHHDNFGTVENIVNFLKERLTVTA